MKRWTIKYTLYEISESINGTDRVWEQRTKYSSQLERWRGRRAAGVLVWLGARARNYTGRKYSYRSAENKETQRTAFILLVSIGCENSWVDMCVSGGAAWSPGKQTRNLLDLYPGTLPPLCPKYLSDRWSSRNSNSLVVLSCLGFWIGVWGGWKRRAKISSSHTLLKHVRWSAGVRCLASKLQNGSQTKSVCLRSSAGGPLAPS